MKILERLEGENVAGNIQYVKNRRLEGDVRASPGPGFRK